MFTCIKSGDLHVMLWMFYPDFLVSLSIPLYEGSTRCASRNRCDALQVLFKFMPTLSVDGGG